MRSQFVGKIMDRNKEILKVQRGGTAEYLLAEGNGTCASQPGQGRRRTTSPGEERQSDIQWTITQVSFLGWTLSCLPKRGAPLPSSVTSQCLFFCVVVAPGSKTIEEVTEGGRTY